MTRVILFIVTTFLNLLFAFTQQPQISSSSKEILFNESIELIQWHPYENIIAISFKDTSSIKIWDVEKETLVQTLNEDSNSNITDFSWSHDGLLFATLDEFYHVKVWNFQTGEQLYSITLNERLPDREAYYYVLSALAWSPNAEQIVIANDNFLTLWDMENDTLINLPKHPNDLNNIVIDTDWYFNKNQVISLSSGGVFTIHNPVSLEITSSHEQNQNFNELCNYFEPNKFVFDPNQELIFTSHNDSWSNTYLLCVRDLAFNLVFSLEQEIEINALAFNSKANRLAFTLIDTVHIRSMDVYEEYLVLEGHTDIVSSIAWSPNGNQLASASYDGTLRIWDIPANED